MRRPSATALSILFVLAGPAAALGTASPARGQEPGHAAPAQADPEPAHVRVTARIVVVDRDALTRAGLAYVVLGPDRVRVSSLAPSPDRRDGRSDRSGRSGRSTGAGRAGGVGVSTHGVSAFLELARERHWTRSESTQRLLVLSGSSGSVSSQSLAAGRLTSRVRGPSLVVTPTVRPDGRVHLWVSTRIEDSATGPWGVRVDGSPAAVETELVVPPGEEVLLASSETVRSDRDSGLLRWAADEEGRDVLVALTAEVVGR